MNEKMKLLANEYEKVLKFRGAVDPHIRKAKEEEFTNGTEGITIVFEAGKLNIEQVAVYIANDDLTKFTDEKYEKLFERGINLLIEQAVSKGSKIN